jgi:hypothetical protein
VSTGPTLLGLRGQRELIGERAKLELDEEVAERGGVWLSDLQGVEIELEVEICHDRDQPLREPYVVGVVGDRPRGSRRLQRLRVRDELLDVGVLPKQSHRGLRPDPGGARHVVGGITHEGQVVDDL